ncbi:efflux RND transporter permease subunit [Temperatibacter marinus]|uniref:Efflux RND transporter permease subunit n=1 Tax=Temperatibacter marinus TaxID=1456591 RepID=A0AA52EK89_9PROT|nr:efflux RND transporter permease subunit [Temperatibacter marinus]WND03764.1 efflux RND transporter permease subunit [Temperatibacter marinus]
MKSMIEFFLRNRVAANLLAFMILITGFMSIQVLDVRLFPPINLNMISITVPYPGATPQEVETSIVKPIEEQIDGLEGVDKVTSLAAAGVANILVKLEDNVSLSKLKDDIQSQVDTITVFPRRSERPVIKIMEQEELVSRIILYGQADAKTLKKTADRIRSDLTDLPNVSRANIRGVAAYLVDVTVPLETLQAMGMSLEDIAEAITKQSMDLSGGLIEGAEQKLLIRATGERRTEEGFRDIVVGTSVNGAPVYLKDIATIKDTITEDPVIASFKNQPASFVTVFRVGDEQVLDLAEDVRGYFNGDLQDRLPEGIQAELWRDESTMLENRLSLLSENALIGLFLVGILLMAFLDIRIALWVAFGVAVSFIGSFVLMAVTDVSIDQMSAFAFILAIGIVVDDAIVVGENIHTQRKHSTLSGLEAARVGVTSISTPVIFSVITTIVAFVPLMNLPGTMGDFLGPLAAVVISVLIFSLVESLLMLPRHLSHLQEERKTKFQLKVADPFRDYFAFHLNRFIHGPLKRVLTFVIGHPGSVLMTSFGFFMLSLSLISSGTVKSVFFPQVEGDYINAQVEFSEATSQQQTVYYTKKIAEAAEATAREFEKREAGPLEGIFWILGSSPAADMSMPTTQGGAASNKAFLVARLKGASARNFTADEFGKEWEKRVGEIPGAQKLRFSADLITQADPVYFEVSTQYAVDSHKAVAAIRAAMERMPGVINIKDDRFNVTSEVQISLKPLARDYGLTQEGLANQIRASFFGAEATRIQRDREEIQVRVRLPKEERLSVEALKTLRLKVGEGFIPLENLANVSIVPAAANINRIDGRRINVISSEIDRQLTTAGQVTNYVINSLQTDLAADFQGLKITLSGEQEEQAQTAPVIGMNYLIALMVIYTILALGFKSYTQPLIVMVAIPFGFMGALVGHGMMGLEMTLLSIFGIIGLSGVIVNNSLMVISVTNEKLDAGMAYQQAILEGAMQRFRPILLTTLTTFLGVTPIILETSIQAQFLVPTAVSLGFGIVIGTSFLVFVTPAMTVIHYRMFGREPDPEATASAT